MLTLRPYQEEAVRKAVEYFTGGPSDPALIVLPTAWGKSVLTAFTADRIPRDERLLVVQPSKELLEQNHAKYAALCGEDEPAGIYSASFGKKEIERITYATIGSIKNIGARFKELGFTKMLIDEAHLYPRREKSMLGGFLRDSGITRVLGITATPLKLEQFGGRNGMHFDTYSELLMLTNPSPSGTFFRKILHVCQIGEMLRNGWWCPLDYREVRFDPSELRYNTTGSEYSRDSVERAYALNNVRGCIFRALDFFRDRAHALVFVPSVEEAALLAADYPGSACISAETGKKEREETIRSFREGRTRVIFNVGVLSTGFDYPKTDLIILGFSTASAGRYYQIVGRGVRPDPDGVKKDCVVIDMGGNLRRFGRVEDIIYEHRGRWRMYGSDGKLLTGLPITMIGTVGREHVLRAYSEERTEERWPLRGKYYGRRTDEIPIPYFAWVLTHLSGLDGRIIETVLRAAEHAVRDTRGEAPAEMMPTGKYAGIPLRTLPRNYLTWFYNSQEWNECSDSLRRGVEAACGGVIPRQEEKKTVRKKTAGKGIRI